LECLKSLLCSSTFSIGQDTDGYRVPHAVSVSNGGMARGPTACLKSSLRSSDFSYWTGHQWLPRPPHGFGFEWRHGQGAYGMFKIVAPLLRLFLLVRTPMATASTTRFRFRTKAWPVNSIVPVGLFKIVAPLLHLFYWTGHQCLPHPPHLNGYRDRSCQKTSSRMPGPLRQIHFPKKGNWKCPYIFFWEGCVFFFIYFFNFC